MLAFVGWRLARSASAIDGTTLRENLPMIGAALALFALGTLLLAGVWIVLIESLTRGERRRSELTIAFLYAWLARYVPGTLPYLAGKVYLGKRIGYATRPLVMATTLEGVVGIAVSVLVGVAMLALSQREAIGTAAALIATLAAAGGLLVLHPRALRAVTDRVLQSVRRAPLPPGDLPSLRAMAAAVLFVIGAQVANGLAMLALLHATAGASWADLPLTIAALSLAGAAGMLVVLAPAGLGVRDGATAAVLAARFTLDAAALATVLLRLLTILSDLTLAALALAFDLAAGKRVAIRAVGGAVRPDGPSIARDAAAVALLAEERVA